VRRQPEMQTRGALIATSASSTVTCKREPFLLAWRKSLATAKLAIRCATYTDNGKPNLKLVSKEFAHRELRAQQAMGREGEFSGYSDTELLSELSRLANDLGIKVTLSLEQSGQPSGTPEQK
jgi:hypothetical protein